jgi:hypothetical protein
MEKQWEWEQKGGRIMVALVTRMPSRYDITQEYQGTATSLVHCHILQDKSGWTDGMLMLRRINIP